MMKYSSYFHSFISNYFPIIGPKKQPKRSRVSEDSDFESEENNDRADVQSQGMVITFPL